MSRPLIRAVVISALLVSLPMSASDVNEYRNTIKPLLSNLCYDCHADGVNKGDIAFDSHKNDAEALADIGMWKHIREAVDNQVMPPAKKKNQPTDAERKTLTSFIDRVIFRIDCSKPDPGRVTTRRLNRREYNFSVQDLCGIRFDPADDFPPDDTGYGFDRIGDVLTLSPILMDKYFTAAEKIVNKALELKHPQSRIFTRKDIPSDKGAQRTYAREIIATFSRRAFRRPVDTKWIDRVTDMAMQHAALPKKSFTDGIGLALQAILVSPRFLFRIETQPRPDDPHHVHKLDEFSLASRLSYFLWNSIPDDALLDLAEKNKLRANWQATVNRMLKDNKAKRFKEDFLNQWLQVGDVETIGIALNEFRDKGSIRRAMRIESESLFNYIIDNNRDVMELLTANYTFLNGPLAEWYGISGVSGNKFTKVDLPPQSVRGGILTQGSFLIVTSNPTRTSPVKRGLFVLENILDTPPPPAPPDVPELEASGKAAPKDASLRQLLEIHRQKSECAGCHARMDPIGLGLENFDLVGRWRDTDKGKAIEATGQLISGEKFNGVQELRKILGNKREFFYRCMARKLLTYALGRGLEYYDICAVTEITNHTMAKGGRFSALLMAVLDSVPFQQRRGDGDRLSPAPGAK